MLASFSRHCRHVVVRARRQTHRFRLGQRLAGSSIVAARGATGGIALTAAASAVVVFASGAAAPGPGGPPKQQRKRGALDFGSPLRRCTDTLLVLNALLFVGSWATKDALLLWGAKVVAVSDSHRGTDTIIACRNKLSADMVNALVSAGQVWRLLTSSFLHTSAFHLLINSYSLAAIGPHVEMLSGRARFMAVYLTSALVGTTASYLLTPAPSVGASAALFGLGASLGMFYWRHRHDLGHQSERVLQQLGVTLAINMGYSLANKRIDNWGHVGGLLGGALVAWLLGPRLLRDKKTGRVVDQPPLPVLARRKPDRKS